MSECSDISKALSILSFYSMLPVVRLGISELSLFCLQNKYGKWMDKITQKNIKKPNF